MRLKVHELKQQLWQLAEHLDIRELKYLQHLLGIKFARLKVSGYRMMLLHQNEYTEELLRRQRLILPDHAPDPRASEWLLRDAKCISALLGEGPSAKSGASRKQGRHI